MTHSRRVASDAAAGLIGWASSKGNDATSSEGRRGGEDVVTREGPLPTFLIIGAAEERDASGCERISDPIPTSTPHRRNSSSSTRMSGSVAASTGTECSSMIGRVNRSWARRRRATCSGANTLMSSQHTFTKRFPKCGCSRFCATRSTARESAMVHHIKFSGLPPDCDIVELVRHTSPEEDPLGIISGGWYAASLTAYLAAIR